MPRQVKKGVEFDVRDLDMLVRDQHVIFKPVLERIGDDMVAESRMNFMLGGRPAKWVPSKRAQKDGGRTLIDKGDLYNSIKRYAPVGLSVSVGADMRSRAAKYAGVMFYGARKGAFGTMPKRGLPIPTGDIPERPYLVILPFMEKRYTEMFGEVLENKLKLYGRRGEPGRRPKR